MASRKKLPQYIAAISISIGAIGTGTAIAWPSNIIDRLKSGKLNGIEMDDDDLGWTGSCVALGAMMICIPTGFICEWIGRRSAALLAAIPLFLGWIMVMFANHRALVYAGRVLTGIGGGAFCVCGPLYTSEISEPRIRGTLGSFFQFFLNIGILYVNILGHAMPSMLFYNLACAAIPLISLRVSPFNRKVRCTIWRIAPKKSCKSTGKTRGPRGL
nr:unnamed protein product [Callosobruchus analis]